jgi:sporulation protein YlmC with PRC-barrel domain
MKYSFLLIMFFFIGGVTTLPPVSAEEPETQPVEVVQATPHAIPGQPFTPIALYQGGFYPIIGVEKKEPLIKVEDEVISLGKDAAIYFWSNNFYETPSIHTEKYTSTIDTGVGHGLTGANFPTGRTGMGLPPLPGAIVVDNRGTDKETSVVDRDPTTPLGEEANNDQTMPWEHITPRQEPLTNAYGVFIYYSEKGIAELEWRKIKSTRQDKRRSLRVPFASKKTLRNYENLRYLLLVFQDGKERIPFDNSEREGFLRWNERASMEKMALAYEKTNEDQTLDPILIFRPDFVISEEAHNELQKMEVSAFLNVTDVGTVSDVYLDSDLESTTAYEITETMRSWRFLPAMREGVRIEEEVEVPLQF